MYLAARNADNRRRRYDLAGLRTVDWAHKENIGRAPASLEWASRTGNMNTIPAHRSCHHFGAVYKINESGQGGHADGSSFLASRQCGDTGGNGCRRSFTQAGGKPVVPTIENSINESREGLAVRLRRKGRQTSPMPTRPCSDDRR